MQNVARERVQIKPTVIPDDLQIIADVLAYIDTIEMFSRRRPSPWLLGLLREACGQPVWYRECGKGGTVWGYVLIVNQPSEQALRILDEWHQEYRCSISRVDIAFDFDPRPHVSRDQVISFVINNIHLKNRRSSDETHQIGETYYAVKRAGRATKSPKDRCSYFNRMGKTDGELDKIHDELRFQTRRAVKAAGIERPIDLITVNPRELHERHLFVASTQSRRERAIEITMKETKPTAYIDIEKRVRALWTRTGCETLTGFKLHYQKHYERLKRLTALNVSETLTWIDVGKGVGEMSPLLPPARKQTRKRITLREKD